MAQRLALRRRPASKRQISRAVVIHDTGYKAKGRIEQRHVTKLLGLDRMRRVPGTPCATNVVKVVLTYTRQPGAARPDGAPTRIESFPGPHWKGSRCDLRMRLPGIPGWPYWHHVLAWFFHYRERGDFASFSEFRKSCLQESQDVDHGADGNPHIVDWRRLSLLAAGPNRSEGRRLAEQYRAQAGSYAGLVALRMRPARRQ